MLERNPIAQVVSDWFRRHFSDPEALGLFFTLILFVFVMECFGDSLKPVLVSVVLAYLLVSPVRWLERCRFPHWLAVLLVYAVFVGFFVLAIVGLLPIFWKQLNNLMHELPRMFSKAHDWTSTLLDRYPNFFTQDPIDHVIMVLKEQSSKIGKMVLSYSLSAIPNVIDIILYLVLVPILVFFFLKDGKSISSAISHYLPSHRGLLRTVWSEVNIKIGAYIRGRVVEMLIVSVVTTITFQLLGLPYSFLLGVLVGVSVIVPYIGAVIVTLPVLIVALMQWGFTAPLAYLLIAYAVIITVDGNILVPVLFSEAMDVHPIVIILSVLIFGGIWGFWGVFFAIPLATVVKAILSAWPQADEHDAVA